MLQFQPGDEAYIRIAFQNVVPIQDAWIIFVHEEDGNEHIMFAAVARDEAQPIRPALQTTFDFAVPIEKGKKPGVYALDKINFITYGGNTLGYRGDVGTPRFEVIPEREVAPIVQEFSIYTNGQWEALRRREQR